MMAPTMVILAALTATFGLTIEHFFLEDMLRLQVIEDRHELWLILMFGYALLLIPPWILTDHERTENTEILIQSTGAAILNVAKWVSIGVLIAIGFHAFY